MTRLNLSFGICMLACTAALLTAATPADNAKKYDIKINLSADQQWSFNQTGKMYFDVHSGGAAQPSKIMEVKQSGTITNLIVTDGESTRAKIWFDKDCGVNTTEDGQLTLKALPLAGQTVQAHKLGDTFTIDGPRADQSNADVIRSVMLVDRTALPTKPVAIGDFWEGDGSALKKLISMGDEQPVVPLVCKLTTIGSVDGRPTADIDVKGDVAQAKEGATGVLSVAGTIRIDLVTGQCLQEDLTTKAKADLLDGLTTVDVKNEIHQTRKLIAPAK